MKKHDIKAIVLAIFTCLLQFPTASQAAPEEFKKTDSAAVYWSPSETMSSLMSFRLYFRPYQSADTSWKFIGSTTDTIFTVKKEMTGAGPFVMAVTTYEYSEESPKHTSLDSTAIPSCGWYLVWVGSTLVVKKIVPEAITAKPAMTAYLLNGRRIAKPGSGKFFSAGYLIKKGGNLVRNEIVMK